MPFFFSLFNCTPVVLGCVKTVHPQGGDSAQSDNAILLKHQMRSSQRGVAFVSLEVLLWHLKRSYPKSPLFHQIRCVRYSKAWFMWVPPPSAMRWNRISDKPKSVCFPSSQQEVWRSIQGSVLLHGALCTIIVDTVIEWFLWRTGTFNFDQNLNFINRWIVIFLCNGCKNNKSLCSFLLVCFES